MNIQRFAAICAIAGAAMIGMPAVSHAAGASAMSRSGYQTRTNIHSVSLAVAGMYRQGGCQEKEMWGPSKRPEMEKVCTGSFAQ
ncbi:hypothetical protein [Granulibacter bethesdensis]|nr:hypothetical protein [Granulibacter bethesdensis]